MNYTSKLSEQIYNVKNHRDVRYLGDFWIDPKRQIFWVDGQYYAAKDQEKVLQWLISRVEYYCNEISLQDNEIISFVIS